MLDFLFITTPTNARNPHPPYYFMYLAAYLRNKGLRVKIIDPKGGDRPHDIEGHYREIGVALRQDENRSVFIGVAAFHSDYAAIIRLGGLIKSIQPGTTLLVGNAHATIDPKDFIYAESPFGVAILGEGEETCWELWNQRVAVLDDYDWPLGKVRGIAYMSYAIKGGEYVRTEPRPFMDLDNLPMPAYDLVDLNFYLKPQKLIIRRIYTSMMCVFAGRGCPFDCSFCAANVVWKANKGKAARLRPVTSVIAEIAHLRYNYNIDFFYLFDDMFGMSKKWMVEWFEKKSRIEIATHSRGVIPYACQTRADVATEEMVRGLKETGCVQLDIGVETGAQRLLDRMNKGITLQQVRQVTEWCRKYGLRSFFTMLLNLPTETEEDLKATYKLLEELKPSAGVIFGVTTPYPGTKIYDEFCHPRLRPEDYSLLINNRLNPSDRRFHMAIHDCDLWGLLDRWNLHFKVNPFFERMWCLKPFQGLYWKAVFRSRRFGQYMICWMMDLVKTPLLCIAHKFKIYRFLKKLQYGDKWK